MLERDLAAGAPVESDGCIDPVVFAAWQAKVGARNGP